MTGKQNGPRIELRVTCDDCQHLECDRSYHAESEEYEHDWFCKMRRDKGEKPSDLSSGCCTTPKWCPLYPSISDMLNAALAVK